MPAKSKKQERFMQAVANNPKFAKKVGVPQSVGKEYTKSEGGTVNKDKNKEKKAAEAKKMAKGGSMPMVMKDGKKIPAFAADGKGKMAKGGSCKTMKKASGGKMKSSCGKKKSYAKGGSVRGDGMCKRGKTKGQMR